MSDYFSFQINPDRPGALNLRTKEEEEMGEDDMSELVKQVEDSLEDLGYNAVTDLNSAVQQGLHSSEFAGKAFGCMILFYM